MTEKPIKIPLATRVMPSIIAHDIKGVSPMVGPVMETARMITERQGEGQVDIEAEIESDIAYFRKKLESAQRRGDDARVQKLQEQLSILEDYKLSRNPPSV